ncbi:MAG: hypothetical protein ABIE03_03670 [Patescibacteria group bacterium]|nr:hypothetical protein [Patescibacteria group bacterium]
MESEKLEVGMEVETIQSLPDNIIVSVRGTLEREFTLIGFSIAGPSEQDVFRGVHLDSSVSEIFDATGKTFEVVTRAVVVTPYTDG